MNASTTQTLVELLAQTDALLWPWRRQGDDPTDALLAARVEYRDKGLPYRNAGDSKARMLKLAELEKAGLVVVYRGCGRASHWKLTDHADEYTRALVGMPGRKVCLSLMRRMLKLAARGDCLAGSPGSAFPEKYIRETDLGGFDYTNDKPYFDASQKLLEKLAFAWPRGWIASALMGGCGSQNAPMAHGVTNTGLAALTMPATKIALPPCDDALADLYCNRFADHFEAWESARPKDHMTIFLQPYFAYGWETVNELSAGTDADAKKPETNQPAGTAGTDRS